MATKRLNFSLLERNILLRLLEENIDIVESKRNDGLTVRRKDETWARIVSRFNSDPNVIKRTPRQLRKCWNNLKMRAKKSNPENTGKTSNGAGRFVLRLPRSAAPSLPVHPISASRTTTVPAPNTIGLDDHNHRQQTSSSDNVILAGQDLEAEIVAKEEPGSPQIVAISSRGSLDGQEGRVDHCGTLILEASSDNDEAPSYHHVRGVNSLEVAEEDSEDFYEDVHVLEEAEEERGEIFQRVGDKNCRHETVAGSQDDLNNQWTVMDCARNEHEAKMALLTIQMETAREQRELARELREQTRQRHRLEMQLLEEKRRYRRVKMNTLSPHGQN